MTDEKSTAPEQGHRARSFFASLRHSGWFRAEDRWLGGVSAGIARRLGIDPLLVRAVCGVLILLTGIGLIAYAAAWALLPEERDGRIHLEELTRGQVTVAWVGIGLFVLIGLPTDNRWWGIGLERGGGFLHGLWILATVVVITLVVIGLVRRSSHQATPPPEAAAEDTATAGVPPAAPAAADSQHQEAAPEPPPSTAETNVPRRPARSVPGPGSTAVGLVLGLALLAVATVLVLHHLGTLPWPLPLLLTGVVAVVCGAGIVMSGLRGRRSGALGVVGVLVIVAVVPLATWSGAPDLAAGSRTAFTSTSWAPTGVDTAENGFLATFSDTTIDLTEIDLDPGSTVEVPIRAVASNLTVLVPRAVPVDGEFNLVASELDWGLAAVSTSKSTSTSTSTSRSTSTSTSRSTSTSGGLHETVTRASSAVVQGAQPQLHLEVHGVAASLTVKEAP